MNYAIVLSGGVGSRLAANVPKQYIEVNQLPIIGYCLKTLNESLNIDFVCVVADKNWYDFINKLIDENKITKFIGFAPAGSSRQHSIQNGLLFCKGKGAEDGDNVMIHDAARPNISGTLIRDCFAAMKSYEGVMPVLTVKDTVYQSNNQKSISGLLNRDELFIGQAPEVFNFGKYFSINVELNETELSLIRGSSEIAFKKGLNIGLIEGDEKNYKITTSVDLIKFINEKEQ